jgi:uncharacterized membrane protein (GlpM family)
MAGFPAVGGPIVFILALERGGAFAADAAVFCLAVTSSSLTFNLAYARACLRYPWPVAALGAVAAWFLAAFLVSLLPPQPWVALAVAIGSLLVMPRLFPEGSAPAGRQPLPRHELALRMAAGAALTLLVSFAAPIIGAGWSGLFAVFPTLGVILSVFSHRAYGGPTAATLLRSMSLGLIAFVGFFFSLALLLRHFGVGPAFVIALAAALAIQGTTMMLMRARST